MLNREAILNQNVKTLKPKRVATPEWGEGAYVFVKVMSGTERDAFEASHLAAKERDGTHLANIRGRLAAFTICDEAGVRLFTDDDAQALGETHAKALDRVFDVARELNKLRAEDVAELEKN